MKDYTKLKNAFHKLQSLYITEVRSNPKHIINEAAFKNDWDEAAGLIDGLNYQEQPVRKTLDQVKDEVKDIEFKEGLFPYVKSLQSKFALTDEVAGQFFYYLEMWEKKRYRENETWRIRGLSPKAVEPQEGWVDVKDRLPEPETTVLLWNNERNATEPYKGYLHHRGSRWFGLSGTQLFSVTHWMNLPSKPTTNK